MNITVKFFAVCRELTRSDEIILDLTERSTGNDLWVALLNKYPELTAFKKRIRLAVNHEYVDDRVVLSEGDQVSLIPPVSGG